MAKIFVLKHLLLIALKAIATIYNASTVNGYFLLQSNFARIIKLPKPEKMTPHE
jgi:hypothetical protein